ncbi:MAG TPA: ABC-F family ATP-binding cassette domain-containing protein [Candidatus Limnocylindrales bacterium]
MSILRFSGVVREVGEFVILDRIDAAIAAGERIGLVGPNGAGKTTLLRLAAGVDEPDRGEIQRKRGLTIGLLAQESHFDPVFMAAPDLRTAVRSGAGELERLEMALAGLEAAHRVTEPEYEEMQHRFEALGGYMLDQAVDEALSGLGFARADWTRPPRSLSGGEQTRAALARLLIADPELLLLDEPTNHLDLDALEWTEEHVRRRSGALVVASHDRAFLDATVARIWEMRDRRLATFRGDYSAYHRQRLERDEREGRERTGLEREIAHETELVQRYRSQRKHVKMHEHEARLARLEAGRTDAPKRARRLAIPTAALAGGALPSRSGAIVAQCEELVVGYAPRAGVRDRNRDLGQHQDRGGETADEKAIAVELPPPVVVARAPFLAIQRGERVGIVGPNGAGKTTLLRTIAGDLAPLDGRIVVGSGVQIGYLAQLRMAAIPGATVLDALLEAMPVTHGEARSYLARFLFRGDDVLKEVRLLSGGERSRLELALLGILPSNLLLLDEPTNHLDIPAREALETFLRESPATVLVVSHDRRFLETICERLWVVGDGLATPFDGGYRAWREAVADGWTVEASVAEEAKRLHGGALRSARGDDSARPASPASSASPGGQSGQASPGGESGPATRVAVARQRAGTRTRPERLSKDAYRRQKTAVEAELTRLGLRKSHLELALSDPATAANFVEVRRIASELADVETALASAEEAWLEIEERAP